ncbi:MAG: rod shape-determining protein [Evtepia gabavorous]
MVVDIGAGPPTWGHRPGGAWWSPPASPPPGISLTRPHAVHPPEAQPASSALRTAKGSRRPSGGWTGPGKRKPRRSRARCLNAGAAPGDPFSRGGDCQTFTPVAERTSSPPPRQILERTPPELAADVAVSGILLTGGGSLLQGMDTLLAARTGMETHLAEDPIRAVALGLEQTLPHLAETAGRKGSLNLARRRQLAGEAGLLWEPSLWKQSSILCISQKKPGKISRLFMALSSAARAKSHSSGNNSSRMCRAFFPPFSKPPRQDLQ